jgi:hypothetical protein
MQDGLMGRSKLGDKGRRIGLVRWSFEGGTWLPEMVVGIVVERAGGIWYLDSNGEARTLNESDWSVYQP